MEGHEGRGCVGEKPSVTMTLNMLKGRGRGKMHLQPGKIGLSWHLAPSPWTSLIPSFPTPAPPFYQHPPSCIAYKVQVSETVSCLHSGRTTYFTEECLGQCFAYCERHTHQPRESWGNAGFDSVDVGRA